MLHQSCYPARKRTFLTSIVFLAHPEPLTRDVKLFEADGRIVTSKYCEEQEHEDIGFFEKSLPLLGSTTSAQYRQSISSDML